VRHDFDDVIYRSYREKRTAVIDELLECQERGQPVLVGTVSVEKSEDLSRVLLRKGIKHHVLNAKQHEREAFVVAQAGRLGAVTVATNMAGRGTDILLGGNPEMLAKAELEDLDIEDAAAYDVAFAEMVAKYERICAEERVGVIRAGGLHILGTERHESRRIDNQLRGRAGRQGDPGSSRFYLSLEDDLMRIFAGERVGMIMDKLGMPEGEPIEHGMVTKSVERAQSKVEARNFDIRKNLLEYDDVMNQQRKTVYALRRQVLEGRYKAASISDSEEVKRHVEQGARKIEVDPVLERRAAAALRSLFLRLGKMPRAEKEGDAVEDRPPRVASLVAIDALEVERQVYDQFGVRVPLAGYDERPAEAYDLVLAECAQSLSEQRERLFDMIDELIGALIEEHVTPQKQASGDLESFYEALRKTFDIWVEGLEKLPGVDEIAKVVFDEVEWVVRVRDAEVGPAEVREIVDEAVHERCPVTSSPDSWQLTRLAADLEKRLDIGDIGDLKEELARLRHGDAEPDAESPPENAEPDVKALRRGVRDAILSRYAEHTRHRFRFLAARDDTSKQPHPAEAVVRELVRKYCDGEVHSTGWRLQELGEEVRAETGAAPVGFELDSVANDARRAIMRNVAVSAREREAEIIAKIVDQTCPGKLPDRWNREKLADELLAHRGVHSSAIETAETRTDLLDGIWRDVREHHHRQVVLPLEERVLELCPEERPFEEWDLAKLARELEAKKIKVPDIDHVELQRFVELRLFRSIERVIRARAHVLSPEAHLHAYRQLLLTEIDRLWIDHLQNMESLRQGIGMRSYGQRDPKREYQREGYQMFQALVRDIQSNAIEKLCHVVFRSEDEVARLGQRKKRTTTEGRGDDAPKGTVRRDRPKVGRNDPCHCGSGKKYKKCCMLKEQATA
jgi:preprotein translocase subunit SecA